MSGYFMQHYKPGMSWFDLMQMRLAWHENTQDKRLSDWENKFGMKAIWQHLAAPTAHVFLQMDNSNFDEAELRNTCEALMDAGKSFVIKPSHLCGSEAVYICDGRQWSTPQAFSPVGLLETNTAEMLELDDVLKEVTNSLHARVAAREAWSLRKSRAGILIEEHLAVETDIRVMTLFGEVQGMVVTGEDIVIDKFGKVLGDTKASYIWLEPIVPTINNWSKRVAKHTDLLRLDFFVCKTGDVFLNEMCAFVWPEATTFKPFLKSFTEVFVNVYSKQTVMTLERQFARVH